MCNRCKENLCKEDFKFCPYCGDSLEVLNAIRVIKKYCYDTNCPKCIFYKDGKCGVTGIIDE